MTVSHNIRRSQHGALGPQAADDGLSYDQHQMPKSLSRVVFSRASDEWATPRALFEELHAEFGFDLDAAATAENAWTHYLGPDAPDPLDRDALACKWSRMTSRPGRAIVWLNPPYSRCREFIAKAAAESKDGATVVCLIPARTDTRYFHEHIYDRETNTFRPGVEVRFLKGRLKFGDSKNSAPFPSMLVIFRPVT